MKDKIDFGTFVIFNQEYRSCKPQTIFFGDKSTDEIWGELGKLGYEECQDIRVKKVHTFNKNKIGIYLGITQINLSIYYEWFDSVDVGVGTIPETFVARKSEYIEVAEIRCEGIKKTYYVPINNIKEEEKLRNY